MMIWDDINGAPTDPELTEEFAEFKKLIQQPNVTMVTTVHQDGDIMSHLADALDEPSPET